MGLVNNAQRRTAAVGTSIEIANAGLDKTHPSQPTHRRPNMFTPNQPTHPTQRPTHRQINTGPSTARLARLGLVAAGLSQFGGGQAFLLHSSSSSATPSLATTRAAPTRSLLTTMAAATGNSTPTLPAMEGTLFAYYRDEYVHRVAFRSGNPAHKKHVVLVGGLGDGLLPVPYTKTLAEALDARGWGLVQVLLSSSYTGFGHASLATDAQELGHLLGFLEDQLGSEAIGLVGHSTGCQDGVVYARDGARQGRLRFIVLQAPVSDREHLLSASDKATAFIEQARALAGEEKGEEMLPREAMWAPITARRYLDLATKEGADDFFSSDLTDEELNARLGHLRVPTLFLFSGADEYVPAHVDAPALGARFVSACQDKCPLPKAVVVDGAKHSGKGHEADIVKEIVAFLEAVEK